MTSKPFSKKDEKAVMDNPEWTAEEFRRARPFAEVFPHLVKTRGPQKAPQKVPVSLRLDPAVVETFKSTGRLWQSRMNEALKREAAKILRKQAKAASADKAERKHA